MAAKKWNIAALWAALEIAWKTDPDADGSDYKFLKATEITFQPTADVIERLGQTNDLVRQEHVIGAKGGKLAFKLELKASGTAAGDGVAAIAAESSQILEAVFGSVVRGTGKNTTSGSTTTSIVLAAGGGAGFSKGMAVEIESQIRFVTAISTDTLTLDRALSGAPLTGVPVYASSLFKRANTSHKSLAFVCKRDGIEYTLLGCKAAVKLEGVNAKGTALISVDVDVGTWSVTTKASLPSTELTGITAVKAPVVKGSPFAIDGVLETIHGFDLDPGHEFQFQESTEDADNKAGHELVNAGPKGSVRAWYAAGHLTDFAAGTSKSLALAVGSRTTGFGIYVPKAQWGQPTLANKDGMIGEDLPFMVNDNGADPELFISVF